MFEMRLFCLVGVVCCWMVLNVCGTIQGNMGILVLLTLVRI